MYDFVCVRECVAVGRLPQYHVIGNKIDLNWFPVNFELVQTTFVVGRSSQQVLYLVNIIFLWIST